MPVTDSLFPVLSGRPPAIRSLALAPSPVWGIITGNFLYTYHNPTWNQTNIDPHRQISRFDLITGQTRTWKLPDEWNANDLTVINGQIILAKWGVPGRPSGSDYSSDGLYSFDTESGRLSMLLSVPDASLVLPPR